MHTCIQTYSHAYTYVHTNIGMYLDSSIHGTFMHAFMLKYTTQEMFAYSCICWEKWGFCRVFVTQMPWRRGLTSLKQPQQNWKRNTFGKTWRYDLRSKLPVIWSAVLIRR